MVIFILGLILVNLEAADAFFTLWAINEGYTELNPILLPIAGSWILPIVKIVPAAFAAWVLSRLANRFPRMRLVVVFGLVLAIGFLGFVLVSNLGEL